MPMFDFTCESCERRFENLLVKNSEVELKCEFCGQPLKREFPVVNPIFKGSGFYETDYKRKGNLDESI